MCPANVTPFVINHIAVRIPRVLIVSRLEGEGGVDEIEIDVVELESLETGLKGGLDRVPVDDCCSRPSWRRTLLPA